MGAERQQILATAPVLADRKENMVISGGYNVWPTELKNAVSSHPAVREVCVVVVPQENWGEKLRSCDPRREGRRWMWPRSSP